MRSSLRGSWAERDPATECDVVLLPSARASSRSTRLGSRPAILISLVQIVDDRKRRTPPTTMYRRPVRGGRFSIFESGGELASLSVVACTSSTVHRFGAKYIALVGTDVRARSFQRIYRIKIRIGDNMKPIHCAKEVKSILDDCRRRGVC